MFIRRYLHSKSLFYGFVSNDVDAMTLTFDLLNSMTQHVIIIRSWKCSQILCSSTLQRASEPQQEEHGVHTSFKRLKHAVYHVFMLKVESVILMEDCRIYLICILIGMWTRAIATYQDLISVENGILNCNYNYFCCIGAFYSIQESIGHIFASKIIIAYVLNIRQPITFMSNLVHLKKKKRGIFWVLKYLQSFSRITASTLKWSMECF